MKNILRTKTKRRLEKDRVSLNVFNKQIEEATHFIEEIEKGNFDCEISADLANERLGNALISLKNRLVTIAMEEKNRNWFNEGLAKFSDILRNKGALAMQDFANNILINLVKYIGANQGAIFLVEGMDLSEQHLNMIACYAYDRQKFIDKRIDIGEGLVGQCVLEREMIYLQEVPGNYISITSGLGEAPPRSVLISPLIVNDEVYGVVELASFSDFEKNQMDFISQLSENIAATIKSARDNDKTLQLLNASQQQAEELQSQEEEMRQNMEELQATQEEVLRTSNELGKAAAEMSGILDGINAKMATIEFLPDGTILTANSKFLNAMKYNLDQIKGKHHKMFAPKDVLESQEYQTFWSHLAAGESFTGIFQRVASTGEAVWLNAIYNPIRNAEGEVVKVVKFATDVTEERMRSAEMSGILEGINATMATIEFLPDGTILTANLKFLESMKYNLDQIKGKHHRMFVPQDVLESREYQSFWSRLAAGESLTGIFQRITSSGETVWLNAIYNPIRNAEGAVAKVVKFATDVTAEKVRNN